MCSPSYMCLAHAQVWELRTKKMLEELPGHADEVPAPQREATRRCPVSVSPFAVAAPLLMTCVWPGIMQVFTVDWSPDGERVCSGGKDRNLKIWRR